MRPRPALVEIARLLLEAEIERQQKAAAAPAAAKQQGTATAGRQSEKSNRHGEGTPK